MRIPTRAHWAGDRKEEIVASSATIISMLQTSDASC